MALRLKTKFTLATSGLVLGVAALVSGLYVARLTRQVLREADGRGRFVARQVFLVSQLALAEAAQNGATPASASPEDVHEYVRRTLDQSTALGALMEAAIGYSATIYEITIVDRQGKALVSTDASVMGRPLGARPTLDTLVHANVIEQMRVLYGPPRVYEVSLPFELSAQPFGDIRIGISSALLRDEISPGLESAGWLGLAAVLLSTLLAAVTSHISLQPLARISAQLDRISAGESDVEPVARGDELGQVSNKISRIGKELRDVREVFSTLRENLNQIMAGLEDGLLLFNAEGRAVLVSPSVKRYLGADAEQLRGRLASEILPEGHPLRRVLHLDNGPMESAENAEAVLEGPLGPRRVGVSAQGITERGARIGALVTLRDLESLERIGSQLQVSERLAAIGRVTAGVAHEVKNPLNSMRVWLEVLKGNLPRGEEPQQAVKMLDSEIERLDRAVKTFLDFTRPVQLRLEETDLTALLREVLEGARPTITRAGLELRADFPAGLPPVRLDRQLIHQAVLNLVLNACQVMKRGGRLAVTLRQNREAAEISVADTGPGIPPELRGKIFQLFFTTRPGGTGIGLANTFRFVQLHNGSVEFETEVNRGTTFRIRLPLARPAEQPGARARDFDQPFAQKV